MRWKVWRKKYCGIVDKLDIDPLADVKAGEIMVSLLDNQDISGLKAKIGGKDCIVCGAGPSLVGDLEEIFDKGWDSKTLISANGATSAFINLKKPDIIVTDLDGKVEHQLAAWEEGSWLVIHAHGDNIDQIKKVLPKISERVIGTTQVNKPKNLQNFGGFTDGDRAAFMAHELGASKIYLAGMDLGKKIGHLSRNKNRDRKLVKLKICKELLSWLAKDLGANIKNITSAGVNIPGVPRCQIR